MSSLFGSPSATSTSAAELPPDDKQRTTTLVRPDDPNVPHIGMVGDTYTILLTGGDTNGRFCVIDMHVPPGGGPGPHRHDFEETFIVLEGQIETTFRGQKGVVREGQTLNIPSNAPHQFTNATGAPVRLLCICSPAGQEQFFQQLGVPVPTRTTPPPKPSKEEQAQFLAKAAALATKYRTELLEHA